MPLFHSVLVASSLHLLTGFISSQWTDLVHVLLAHPKVFYSLLCLFEPSQERYFCCLSCVIFIYYPNSCLLIYLMSIVDEESFLVQIDIFMDVAFRAVCIVSRSLSMKLSGQYNGFCVTSDLMAEQTIYYLCQQCEASLQFLHSLCQNKTFRECLLRNKVCEKPV